MSPDLRRRRGSARLIGRRLTPEALVAVSRLVDRSVVDADGNVLGKVRDVVVRWDGAEPYPLVAGFVVDAGGQEVFLPAPEATFGASGPIRASTGGPLGAFVRRSGELRLGQDVAARQVVDVDGVRVLRLGELYVAPVLGRLRLVAAEGTGRGGRLLAHLRPAAAGGSGPRLVDWAAVAPVAEPGSQFRLRVPHEGLRRLRPGELADVLEALDESGQEELTTSLDPAQAADALEEMEAAPLEDLLHRVGPERASALIAAMEPDEAADALRDLDRAEADRILAHLPPDKARQVSAVLGYPESMAGGFMTTTLVLARPDERVGEVRRRLAEARDHASDLDGVVVVDEAGRLVYDLGLLALAIASDDELVEDLVDEAEPVTVAPDAFLDEVVERLRAARRPSVVVVDDDGRPIGRVLADDVIDALSEGGLRGRLPWLLR